MNAQRAGIILCAVAVLVAVLVVAGVGRRAPRVVPTTPPVISRVSDPPAKPSRPKPTPTPEPTPWPTETPAAVRPTPAGRPPSGQMMHDPRPTPAPDATPTVEIRNERRVSGSVMSMVDGLPVKNALVTASPEGWVVPGPKGITDSSGVFELNGLPEGRRIPIAIWAPGFKRKTATVPPTSDWMDLELAPAPAANLVVTDTSGRPVQSYRYRVHPGHNVAVLAAEGVANNIAGIFELPPMDPGRWIVEVSSLGAGGLVGARAFTLSSAEDVNPPDVALSVGAMSSLNGRVASEYGGPPIAGAEVTVRRADEGPESGLWPAFASRIATTDSEGEWVVQGLAPGRFTVSAARDGKSGPSEDVELPSGSTRRVSVIIP